MQNEANGILAQNVCESTIRQVDKQVRRNSFNQEANLINS